MKTLKTIDKRQREDAERQSITDHPSIRFF